MKRLLILLAGVVFALGLLELGLRALGFASALEASRSRGGGTPALTGTLPPPPPDPSAFRILCLGNSHTQGAGTDPYPWHLERLLREKYPGRAFQVINTGRGNWNSSEVLAQLPGFLAEYRPQVVFAMVGEPNYWNYRHYQQHLASGGLYDSLRFLKVVRLLDLLRRFDPRHEPVDGRPGQPFPVKPWFEYPVLAMEWVAWLGANPDARVPAGDLRVAAAALEKWTAHPEGKLRRRAWSTLAEIYLRLGESKKALRAARRVMEPGSYDFFLEESLLRHRPPGTEWKAVAELLATLRSGRPTPEELRSFLSGALKNPGVELARFAYDAAPGEAVPAGYLAARAPKSSFSLLLAAWKENPESSAFGELAAVKGLKPEERTKLLNQSRVPLLAWRVGGREQGEGELASKEIAREQLGSELESLKRWVASDLRRITEISRDFGARVALQTYPPYRFSGAERWPDNTIRAEAASLGVPLVDVSGRLRELYARGDSEAWYRREHGIRDDNHLNSRGNLEIARLMLERLEELGWLSPPGD